MGISADIPVRLVAVSGNPTMTFALADILMENQTNLDASVMEPAPGGFSGQPVPRPLIEEILRLAQRAPSGTNTQPWNVYVLQGAARVRVAGLAAAAVPALLADAAAQDRFRAQYRLQPGTGLWPGGELPLADPDFLSEAVAAHRVNPSLARAGLERYFRFFDAPVGLVFTISQALGVGSVLDYGMFLQNIALAAQARGLASFVQRGWKGLAGTLLPQLNAPPDMLLLCGMALGYRHAGQALEAQAGAVLAVESFTTWHN